jgi:hypothetical protein
MMHTPGLSGKRNAAEIKIAGPALNAHITSPHVQCQWAIKVAEHQPALGVANAHEQHGALGHWLATWFAATGTNTSVYPAVGL